MFETFYIQIVFSLSLRYNAPALYSFKPHERKYVCFHLIENTFELSSSRRSILNLTSVFSSVTFMKSFKIKDKDFKYLKF